MKKTIINMITGALACIPLLLGVACSDDDDNGGTGPNTGLKITSTDTGVEVSGDGTTAEIIIPPTGGSFELTITADGTWTLSDRDDDWCVLTGSGKTLRVSALEFASDHTRQTMIRIMVGEVVAGHIYVTQDGTEVATLELGRTEVVFAETGGTADIGVTSNKEWTVTGYEDLGWLEVSAEDDHLTLTAVRNDVPVEFEAVLTVTAGTDLNYKTREITVSLESWSPAFLNVDRDMAVIPEEGGEARIEVLSNREWNVSTTSSWLSVEKEGNEVVITAPPSTSGDLETEIYFETTSGKDHAEFTLPVRQYADPFILEYTITQETLSAAVPLVGNVNCYVDWGDGASSSYSGYSSPYGNPAISHEYQNAGVYQVKMYGSAEGLATYPTLSDEQSQSITAILAWGSLGFTDLFNGFTGTNITGIPDGYQEIFRNATQLSSIFTNCRKLATIPADLLNDLQVTQLVGIFFGCTSLREIPPTLFQGTTEVTGVPSIFRECVSLKSIPEGLFDGMPNLGSVLYAFADCISLETVPVDIFDNCRALREFYNAFNGCSSWTGSSPYTMVGDVAVHLYERVNFPGDFAEPTSYSECFTGCTRLDDYNNIPGDWK